MEREKPLALKRAFALCDVNEAPLLKFRIRTRGFGLLLPEGRTEKEERERIKKKIDFLAEPDVLCTLSFGSGILSEKRKTHTHTRVGRWEGKQVEEFQKWPVFVRETLPKAKYKIAN